MAVDLVEVLVTTPSAARFFYSGVDAMRRDHPAGLTRVRAALENLGLLLLADNMLPSVAGLVAGGPIRGSWWGHARGQDIFRIATALADDDNVLGVKLVNAKVTFVARPLWSAFLAVARAEETWQKRRLSAPARALYRKVMEAGRLRLDQLPSKRSTYRPSESARELETRLLLYADSVHTESGKHAKYLESWGHWLKRTGFRPRPMTANTARAELEDAVRKLGGTACLPWQMR